MEAVAEFGNEMLKMKPFANAQMKLQKNAPEILLVTGVVGMLTGTVLACRATLKAPAALAKAKEEFGACKIMRDRLIADPENVDYSEQEYRQDIVRASSRAAMDFGKLYVVPATIMAGSIYCIFKGHGITVQRNAGLTATVAALTAGLNSYRQRVRDIVGEDKESEIYYDVREETIEVVDAKGKVTKEKVKSAHISQDVSVYAKYFDDASTAWQASPELNMTFLRCTQNYMNDRLKINGHLFLNEVYDALGLPRTKEGAVVGWKINSEGDNYVDFGIYRGDTWSRRRFVNGEEHSILLDFNVNGVIWDLI